MKVNGLFKTFCIIIIIQSFIISSYLFFNKSDVYFNKERELYISDYSIYKNFSKSAYLKDLNYLRKKSRYRKAGYSGHPNNYFIPFPLDYTIILNPVLNNTLIYLLVIIHCRPNEFYERMLFRKIISSSLHYKVIYITSKSTSSYDNYKIKYEAYTYGDILQFNSIISYFNLTIQTIYMLLWSRNINFSYLLKSDIDVFINLPLITEYIKKFNPSNQFYAIGRKTNAFVIRNEKYSHYVPYSVIKDNKFPPYLQGLGYIIPFNTVKLICKNLEKINPKIWIEDVYMGYLFKYNNITLLDISTYIVRELPNNISSIISNANKYMFIHGLYPIEIYLLKYS